MVLKPLEYATAAIIDYSYLHKECPNDPIASVANNSKSEMTLYLSANQKKMVLQEVRKGYTRPNVSVTTDLHVYRPSAENYWASGEKEKSNVEFCGITFKKIIKIQ